jgi:hypothetical protein
MNQPGFLTAVRDVYSTRLVYILCPLRRPDPKKTAQAPLICRSAFQLAEAASKHQVRNFFACNKINNLQASF